MTEYLIQTNKDSEHVKRSIQKKWNLDQFLEEASQKEDINQQVKDMKENFKKEKGKSCGYCGKTGAHPPGRNCPA